MGAGTKQALEELGLEPVFVPSKATGKVLAQELPGPAESGRVLYPASAKAAKDVEDGLSARGFQVVRLNTYDTVSASWTDEQRQLGQAATVVALASPSATQIWAERMGTQHPAACIGETSAKACREAGFSQVFFPESPGLEGWADSVEQALAAAVARAGAPGGGVASEDAVSVGGFAIPFVSKKWFGEWEERNKKFSK